MEIVGALVAKEEVGFCASSPVSYESIRKEMELAVNNPDVKTIVMRVDSGGGVANQMVDLNDDLRSIIEANKDRVRFIASVDDMACSAAFGVIAPFPERYVSRTGMVGSVGVVMRHRSIAGALDKAGVKDTYIHAGAQKVLGNESEPLSDAAREMIESRIAMHYDLFVGAVSASTGISEAKIRETEAAVYQGQAAVDVGFATGIKTYTQLMKELSENMSVDKNVTNVEEAKAEEAKAEEAKAEEAKAEEVKAEEVNAEEAKAEEAKAEKAKAEEQRVTGIKTMCDLAGIPAEKTEALIKSGVSVDAAAPLIAVASSTNHKVDSHADANAEEGETSADVAKSWEEALK